MKKLSVLLLQKKKWLRKQQGYGLLQLSIILALILIICSLSLPSFHFLQHRLLRLEIDKMLLMFRYLQRVALVRNQDQCLQLSLKEGWYEGGGRREYLSSGACFGVLVDSYGPPSAPTQLLTMPSTYKDDKIIFYAQGTMQAGTLYITDSQRQVMYAVSSSVSPSIEMRSYRYDTSDWKWIAL